MSGVMRRRNSTYSSVWKNVISSGVSSSGVKTWRSGEAVRAAHCQLQPTLPPRASICPTRSYFSSRSCVMRIRCGFIG